MTQRLLATVASGLHHSVLITDAAGLTVWVNAAFEQASGFTLAQMLGRTPGSVLQGTGTDKPSTRLIGRALRAGQPVVDQEVLNYNRDGRPVWVELNISPVHADDGRLTHWVAIRQDITTRRLARQASAAQSHCRDMALQAAGIGIWSAQPGDNGLLVDDTTRRLLGQRGLGGMSMLRWHDLPPALARWHQLAGPAIANGGGLELEAWVLDEHGRRCLQVSGQRVDEGSSCHLVGLLTDVTARRDAKTRAESNTLQAMLGIERQDVLGRLRREFRMPLNSLLGFAQLARTAGQGKTPEAMDQRIGQIESAGLQLLDMLDELLAAASDTGHAARGELQPVGLSDALVRHLPREVAVVSPGRLDPHTAVWADPTLLRRALNLAGGLGLAPGASGSGPRLEVWSDQPQRHQHLRFTYAGDAQTHSAAGQDLRMDLLKRLQSDMGGSCELIEFPDRLQLTLTLRAAAGLHDIDSAAADARLADVWAVRPETTGQVWYVEDDVGNLAVVEGALASRPGVQLRTAPEADTLQAMLSQGPPPQLLLIDLMLPGRSGRELLAWVRADARFDGMACAVLTSINDPREEASMRALGAAEYLTKPLRLDRLLDLVDRTLGVSAK